MAVALSERFERAGAGFDPTSRPHPPPPAAERWPELVQFLGGYLHQDFDLDGTAQECIEHAIRERDDDSRRRVLASLRELRAERPSEYDLALALRDLGMEYIPSIDGYTYGAWVDWIITRLAASVRDTSA